MRDVDEAIRLITARLPSVEWSQLQVSHPGADDDGLWFFRLPTVGIEVQIESSRGVCPFIVETDGHNRYEHGATVERTVDIVVAWLLGMSMSEPPEMDG